MSIDTPSINRGTRLQHRLVRAVSRRTQLGCNLLLGGVLGSIGVAILLFAITHQNEANLWVPYVAGGGFAVAGVWRLVHATRLAAAGRLAETVVEVDVTPLRRGGTAKFFFQQRGPLTLESFRADLVGAETVRTQAVRGVQWTTSLLARVNIVDNADVEIAAATPMEVFATLQVPPDLVPTLDTEDRRVTWTIEVEGRVRRGPDFNHAFRIPVV